jgi:tRNA(fMet)-specific endonuclease VapC
MGEHAPEVFFLSQVSFHEQILGAHDFINRARSADGVVRGYELMADVFASYSGAASLLPFDASAEATFARLRSSKVRIGTMDLRIAAIALKHDLTILSRNTRDSRKVPDLSVEDWIS